MIGHELEIVGMRTSQYLGKSKLEWVHGGLLVTSLSCRERTINCGLILEVNNNIALHLDLPDLLQAIAISVRRVIQCDLVGVALPETDGIHLRAYAHDFPDGKGLIRKNISIRIENTGPGMAFRTGQAVVMGINEMARLLPAGNGQAPKVFSLLVACRSRAATGHSELFIWADSRRIKPSPNE